MTRSVYNLLLTLVADALRKPRQRIGVEERVSLTLLHLGHAAPIQTLAWSYKLGRTTVRNIILETCDVFWRLLSPIYVAEPTEEQYKDIANDFQTMWNMANCVGAIDGKHIALQCPRKSGSMFFNYKKFHSIVLMAACDAKYTFTAVSIGSYGSQSDAGIFQVSEFGQSLISNTLPLPPDRPLRSGAEPFPHFFVGDNAFPLRRNIMMPYS
ncbi:putative nuclease HARBI1, partial [Rhagoletis pomonella]|uniref:putative nuclease HARBI1 n=1 Tax=Rhagoletis pomonella TaxID=28610 RepID=UPI00177F470D